MTRRSTLLLVPLSLLGLALLLGRAAPPAALAAPAADLAYDQAFWQRWCDGKAELAGYELTFPRYGQPRAGVAVTIVVKEDLLAKERVKANDPSAQGAFPAMKLNLVQDFATGIYDYGLMTSAWVGLQPGAGLPAGAPHKVSFSAQEWCGHAYQQVVFGPQQLARATHSYFEGEPDGPDALPARPGGLAEDLLLLWARGMVAPRLAPGEERQVPLLTSCGRARLLHRPQAWVEATLRREAALTTIEVPAGKLEARVLTLKHADRTWTVWVEDAEPYRVLAWRCSDGEEGKLLKSARLAYWQLHGAGQEKLLAQLGLSPRPARTP
ncbi:MAG: hypothetical protein AB7N76_36270 [Planctomycetota bacterium]